MRPSLVRNEGGLVTAWTALGKRLVRNEVGLGHSLDNGRTAIGSDSDWTRWDVTRGLIWGTRRPPKVATSD